MHIVLVYPPNDMHKVAYNVMSKRKKRYGHQPPIGIGYVAAIAENAGHTVNIVDGVANNYSIEECAEAILALKPDIVGFSVMTHVKNEAISLGAELKRRAPKIPIVVGGAHAFYFQADILQETPDIDFVLYGEVERSWGLFLSVIDTPDRWNEVDGLCFHKDDGSIQINNPPKPIDNLDEIPMPSWHLFDSSLYRPLPFQLKGRSFFSLITSRGCAYAKCAFCFQAGSNRQAFRRHTPERVVEEIKHLVSEYGVTDIAFWDDTFSTNIKWLRRLKELLDANNISVNWTCSTKASYLNYDNMKVMKESGCWSIFLGIESGDENVLNIIEKGSTLDHARKAAAAAKQLGVEIRAAFMLGLPGETPEIAMKTIEFAKELDPMYAVFYATHPRVGTKLHEMALSYGAFLDSDFRGMTGITYLPHGYDNAEQLRLLIRKAYTQFYLRPRQVMKFVKKIRSFSALHEAFLGLELFLGLRN